MNWGEGKSLVLVHLKISKGGSEMSKEFYYEFEPGFNTWYVLAPLCVLVFLVFGLMKFYMVGPERKIARRGVRYQFLLKGCALVTDLAMGVLVVNESLVGVMQFLVNHLAEYESPRWVFPLTVIILTAMTATYFYILIGAAKIGSLIMLGYLMELRQEVRRKQSQLQERKPQQSLRLVKPQEKAEVESLVH